jgi:hypothetical protein
MGLLPILIGPKMLGKPGSGEPDPHVDPLRSGFLIIEVERNPEAMQSHIAASGWEDRHD